MSRPKSEINPVPGQRLKLILDEQGISQSKLAKEIHLSQQTISRIIQGTASLTPQTAGLIIDLYPQYRASWLLGFDEQKTAADQLRNTFQTMQQESDQLWNGLLCFAKLNNIEISFADPSDAYTQAVRGYTITCNGKSGHISIGDMNNLQNEISDFVKFKLQRIIDQQNTTPETHSYTVKDGTLIEN